VTLALALVLVPLGFAALAAAVPSQRFRPWLLPICAAIHGALTLLALSTAHVTAVSGWLRLDHLGRLVLAVVSVLFFACSLYAPGYLALRTGRSNRVFVPCLLFFLAMTTLVVESQHLGLMWVAIEATTLATAPLLHFNHNARSIEATWKYLLIGSVGIALALFGTFFLAYAALRAGLGSSLFFSDLVREAPRLSRPWLHAAFVLLFVGYGTKMGLAPMHTWKPDAYGEAPGIVGTLLAGALTSCAFLALLRFFRIVAAGGEAAFARQLMIAVGLLSMAVAGVFMARQRDYKRMLAYSSVEHMGILVLGVGIGGLGVFGALLHLVNNAVTKGVLFLSAGNIHRAYGSKSVEDVRGALRRLPFSGALLLAGFFAITGSPPFAPFLSEFTIVRAAMTSGHGVVGALFLVMLAVVFIGMGGVVLSVVQGDPPAPVAEARDGFRDRFGTVAPIALLMAVVVLLGVYVPGPVSRLVQNAATFVEVKP
jgi:hydrogenase-4 component F